MAKLYKAVKMLSSKSGGKIFDFRRYFPDKSAYWRLAARGSALNNTPSLTATAATRVSTGGQLHAEHGQQVVYLNFLRHSYADAL
jgi:hypothetical protein